MIEKTRFYHFRVKRLAAEAEKLVVSPKGGVTICTVETEAETGVRMLLGVAVCSELDSFSRAKGRMIAENRARKGSAHYGLSGALTNEEDLETHGYDNMWAWALRMFKAHGNSKDGYILESTGCKTCLCRQEDE